MISNRRLPQFSMLQSRTAAPSDGIILVSGSFTPPNTYSSMAGSCAGSLLGYGGTLPTPAYNLPVLRLTFGSRTTRNPDTTGILDHGLNAGSTGMCLPSTLMCGTSHVVPG